MISMILGSASSAAGTFRKAILVRLAIISIPRRAYSLHAYTICDKGHVVNLLCLPK